MIISTIAALLGSGLGGAVRAAVTIVERQLGTAEPSDAPIRVSGSLVAAITAGIVCSLLGRGPRLAFWFGALLAAAGTERIDWWVLRRLGVDPQRLMEQARAVAAARASRRSAAEDAA
jgi:hypothetical protein